MWRSKPQTLLILLRRQSSKPSKSTSIPPCLCQNLAFDSPVITFWRPSKTHFSDFLRTFSFSRSVCSAAAALGHELDYGYRDSGPDWCEQEVQEEEDKRKIPVKAYFLSTSIDLKGIQSELLLNAIPPTSRTSNFIVLRFFEIYSKLTKTGQYANVDCTQYMVVFQYGSAVLFNVEDDEAGLFLNIVRRHASGLLQEMRKDGNLIAGLVFCISFLANSKTIAILMMIHKGLYFHLLRHILTRPDVSDYAVKENPELAEDMHGGPDCIVLKCLDTDAIRIIGSVLGQSIALDYFVSQVDGMVEEFAEINRAMEKTGTFTMRRKKLFQLVGKANSNLADIILKVGLFDRSEIAWREAKYAVINEYMREEYEVSQRFGNLDLKLKFVEHNIHFLQEALQNRKSHLLEWCVIYLLTIQNVLSVYEIVLDSTAAGPL